MKKILLITVAVFVLIAGYISVKNDNVANDLSTEITRNGSSLDLSGKNLTKVPGSIFDRDNIEELNLSNNSLTGALPSQIQNLKSLRVLNLSNNKFTGVPAEVGQLSDLEVLDLSNNLITGLPNEIGNLSKLKLLDLSGNKYSEADLSNIKKSLSSSTVIKVN